MYFPRNPSEATPSQLIYVTTPTEHVYSRSSSPTLAQHDEHSTTVERYQAAYRALPDHGTISHLRAAPSDLGKAVRVKPYIHLFDKLLAELRAMPTSPEVAELKERGRVSIAKDGQGRSAAQLRREVHAMMLSMGMWRGIGAKEDWQKLTVQARNAIAAMSRL